MPTPVMSVSDGPRTTVADLIGNPKLIPARILSLLDRQFISQALMRNAGPNANGLVRYEESSPLFLGRDVEDVAEFAEIPTAPGQVGTPRIVFGTKKGLGIRVSREMRDEQQIDQVNRQVTQLTNTFIRADERACFSVFGNPNIPTIAAGAAWDTTNGRPRHDIAAAIEKIASATANGIDDGSDYFGFEANTVVLPGGIVPTLLDNDDFNDVYRQSPLAPEAPEYTGQLPGQVYGLDVLRSRTWPVNKVLVLERGVSAFYSDTRALEATGLYPEGGGPNGGPTETWRSDVTRKRVYGVDQPLAACWITGVTS